MSKIEHYDNSQTEYKKGIMGRIYTNRGSSVSFNISGITDVVLTKAYNETIIQKQNIGGELFKAVVVKRNSDNTYWL
ncbi:MAG: hypothetical protein LBG59_08945 [Candidatus Peribacteria bacterium]|nr:hypothetical protein [Candidatus Peribacteria bacterium]